MIDQEAIKKAVNDIIKAIGEFRVAGGKIKEMWQVSDMFGLMQQIGVIPAAAKK